MPARIREDEPERVSESETVSPDDAKINEPIEDAPPVLDARKRLSIFEKSQKYLLEMEKEQDEKKKLELYCKY